MYFVDVFEVTVRIIDSLCPTFVSVQDLLWVVQMTRKNSKPGLLMVSITNTVSIEVGVSVILVGPTS